MPYVRFDSISGYKYTGRIPHLTNIYEGQIVYDHIMPINNKGYCSVSDYLYKKKWEAKGGWFLEILILQEKLRIQLG